jgi:hypothetical protein
MTRALHSLTTASVLPAHARAMRHKSNQPSGANPAAPVDFRAIFQTQSAVESTPASTATPAPIATAASVAQPSIFSVSALPNGGLMSNPTGNNALTGGAIPYNPNYYATPQAAVQLAQQLGGTVSDQGGQFSNNQSEYYINLPNGISINAGNLVAICNNPVYQGNAGVMDHMVAQLLNNNAVGTTGVGKGMYSVKNGQVTYDPNTQIAMPPSPFFT